MDHKQSIISGGLWSFPYEPGDFVHFLGPRGSIGLGSIADIYGNEFRVVHGEIRSTTISSDYILPTNKTRKLRALKGL